jgi:hypothetical protein
LSLCQVHEWRRSTEATIHGTGDCACRVWSFAAFLWEHVARRTTSLRSLASSIRAPQYDPQETWGQSVILFNTWLLNPPSDVPFSETNECESEPNTVLHCNPFEEWKLVQVTSSNETNAGNEAEPKTLNVKIWLL